MINDLPQHRAMQLRLQLFRQVSADLLQLAVRASPLPSPMPSVDAPAFVYKRQQQAAGFQVQRSLLALGGRCFAGQPCHIIAVAVFCKSTVSGRWPVVSKTLLLVTRDTKAGLMPQMLRKHLF